MRGDQQARDYRRYFRQGLLIPRKLAHESITMTEPDAATLNQPGIARRLQRWMLATRPAFLTVSVLPVLAGTVWGWRVSGSLDGTALALALGATVLAHGGINVLNDVYDDMGGTDRVNVERIFPFTGGSRFIQNGVLSRAQMARFGAVLLVLATMVGLVLAALKGWPVLALGAGAIALGVLYSSPRAALAGRGLGELAVGIGFGPIPLLGAAWLQSASVDTGAAVLSLVIGIWAALILLVNEVPDAAADGETGKRTLVVRLGFKKTAALYFFLHVLAVAMVVGMVAFDWLSPWAVALPVVLLVFARSATRAIAGGINQTLKERRAPIVAAIKTTLAIHTLGTLWLAGWVLAGI